MQSNEPTSGPDCPPTRPNATRPPRQDRLLRLRLRLINLLLRYVRRVLPRLERKMHRRKWEHLWHVESRRPHGALATTVPEELAEAVETGWFPSGCRVLDLGSGRGQISAWLAERGFAVVGGDLAGEAVQLARREFGEIPGRLEFRRLDILHDAPDPGSFDALLDRGCLHTIPAEFRRTYARNVAGWCRPGGRLLLLHRQEGEAGALLDSVRSLLKSDFELEHHARTRQDLERSAGPLPRQTAPGMAFWFVRR